MIPTASLLRAAGLQVTTGYPPPGHPKLFVRYPRASHWRQRLVWQELTPDMWERMQAAGIVSGFLEGSGERPSFEPLVKS